MATSTTSREEVWFQKLISRKFCQKLGPTNVYYDNKYFMKLYESPTFHDRSKHNYIKYHSIRELIQKKFVEMQCIPTDEHRTEILTKPLSKVNIVYFMDKMGVAENVFLTEREC